MDTNTNNKAERYEVIHYYLRNRFLNEASPSWATPRIIATTKTEDEALALHEKILKEMENVENDVPDIVHITMKDPDKGRVFIHTFHAYDDYEARVKSAARAAYKEYKRALIKKFPRLADERI